MTKECQLLQLPKIEDERGNLTFLQNNDQIPFEIKRVRWIYDLPDEAIGGRYATHQTQEIVIALSGSFELKLHNGQKEKLFLLRRSYNAVYIPPLVWRSIGNFSTNSLALIISSRVFDKTDYIKDFRVLKELKK